MAHDFLCLFCGVVGFKDGQLESRSELSVPCLLGLLVPVLVICNATDTKAFFVASSPKGCQNANKWVVNWIGKGIKRAMDVD
jgi:hypothetical protein